MNPLNTLGDTRLVECTCSEDAVTYWGYIKVDYVYNIPIQNFPAGLLREI